MNGRREAVRKRATNPVAFLLLVAAFPTVILFGAWRFASSHDDSAPPAPDVVAEYSSQRSRTPVLSLRRTPAVLARETSSTAFEQALRPLGGAVLSGSCAAVSVDGVLVLSDGIDTPVTPASTMKFIVAAVALDVLGPDYVFTTEVRAELVNGAVGSLYLVGGGDPLLSSQWYPNDAGLNRFAQQPATPLEVLAQAVVDSGVLQVAGNVVGDASRYDTELYVPSWPIGFRAAQGGPIAGLVVNDATVFSTRTKTTDPAGGAAQELQRLLRERGVTIAGAPTGGSTPSGLPLLASVSSAPLSAIVGELLRTSDNNTAEMLLKEIGHVTRRSGTRAAGISTVKERLAAWGVPMQGFTMVDGSGLSRENKIACSTMMALLDRFGPGETIVSALAVAGQTGTLDQYFVETALENRLVGKTGSLTGVKGLIGYLPVEGGSLIRFTLLLESPGVDDPSVFVPIWEEMLGEAIGSYPSGPTLAELVPLAVVPR
ncbi:MAG: D-alanyl-D-alanine carboxypeptidase/D-alanyl-D-alanine-endopeptidase [Actinobacteria bacterium]|nr:D-alanyl-D-alanine carboxypeptidase/D-alanyl-D-alanine-endopeptidase [Actinomycetota bacterium]